MSQYFSRLAARSAVAETAASGRPRTSIASETAAWGEQNKEHVVSGTAPVNSDTSSASAENYLGIDIVASGLQEKISTHAVFENKKNTLNTVEDTGITEPEKLSVILNSMDSISKSTTAEQRQTSAVTNRKTEHYIDETSFNPITSNTLDGNTDVKTTSTYSARATASALPEPVSSSSHSKLPTNVESQTSRNENAVSRAEKNLLPNTGDTKWEYENNATATGSPKTASGSIEMSGNNSNERVSSRPPSISEVSELVSPPSSRSHTQVHIGKIELEIHAAPQKAARPAPVPISPTPVAAAKRTAGFNPSRHYLRSR
jgi:hypothetical protein